MEDAAVNCQPPILTQQSVHFPPGLYILVIEIGEIRMKWLFKLVHRNLDRFRKDLVVNQNLRFVQIHRAAWSP